VGVHQLHLVFIHQAGHEEILPDLFRIKLPGFTGAYRKPCAHSRFRGWSKKPIPGIKKVHEISLSTID
jgi:hypothetical protein